MHIGCAPGLPSSHSAAAGLIVSCMIPGIDCGWNPAQRLRFVPASLKYLRARRPWQRSSSRCTSGPHQVCPPAILQQFSFPQDNLRDRLRLKSSVTDKICTRITQIYASTAPLAAQQLALHLGSAPGQSTTPTQPSFALSTCCYL